MRTSTSRALLAALCTVSLLGIAACGSDDGDVAIDAGDAAADPGSFCSEVEAARHFFQPEAIDYDEAADTLGSITPPEEIRDDWNQLVAGIEVFADADFSDPENIEELFEEEEIAEAFEAIFEADARITEYVLDECGIDLDA